MAISGSTGAHRARLRRRGRYIHTCERKSSEIRLFANGRVCVLAESEPAGRPVTVSIPSGRRRCYHLDVKRFL